jgi:hypothetical protein
MSLLKEPYEMMFHTVFHPAGRDLMDKLLFMKCLRFRGAMVPETLIQLLTIKCRVKRTRRRE